MPRAEAASVGRTAVRQSLHSLPAPPASHARLHPKPTPQACAMGLAR